jgi:hypothetical protein
VFKDQLFFFGSEAFLKIQAALPACKIFGVTLHYRINLLEMFLDATTHILATIGPCLMGPLQVYAK